MKKSRIFIFLLMITGMLTMSVSCTPQTKPANITAANPELIITGDVETEIAIYDFGEYEAAEILYNDEELPSIKLSDLLEDAIPVGEQLSIFLCSPDGVMAQIPLDEIDEECVLFLTLDNGWVFYSKNHPRQSGIKNMDKIVVYAEKTAFGQKCFRMIYGEDYITRTYGQLFLEDSLTFSVLEGQAKMNENTTNAYTRRQLIPLSDYLKELGAENETSGVAYFSDGSCEEIDLSGYLEWRGTTADYIGIDKKSRKADIIGIWVDSPQLSVTDLASISLDKLKEGNVLIIELDGFGYYNLMKHTPDFIGGFEVYPMRTVMPAISNVALSAIITGEMPQVNGIIERGQRELNVTDMFEIASGMGFECAVVEGRTALVTMSVEQTLNPDINNSGDTDNEVQEAAFEKIAEGYQFIFVHFHGFDDVAHTYGPSSGKAAEKVRELDDYVKILCDNFEGTVIITADHGQRLTNDEDKPGGHGEFMPIDLTVPFIIFEVN